VLCGVGFRDTAAGRDFLDESDEGTAFRTSVIEVLAEPWPDFLRWWCMAAVMVRVNQMSNGRNLGKQPKGMNPKSLWEEAWLVGRHRGKMATVV
jgi:hypothetical protein